MAKILFISTATLNKSTGGTYCSKRNLKVLQDIFGEKNVDAVYTASRDSIKLSILRLFLFKPIDILLGNMNGFSIKDYRFWANLLKRENPEIVFLDSSTIGNIIPLVRKLNPNILITTFFHNVESIYMKQWVLRERKYYKLYYFFSALRNEKKAITLSNKVIFLNSRDLKTAGEIYQCNNGTIIPISGESHKILIGHKDNCPRHRKVGLFVGSWFYANEHGISWFLRNVLPKVEMLLIIVGFGMDKLNIPSDVQNKVKVYSNVPSLDKYYYQANFVISPIFLGSGMKVKTCEALSYGKYIIGSDEAWEGYDYNLEVGARCSSAEEFVSAINNYNAEETFNQASYDLFERKYSYEAVKMMFEKVFNN